MNPIDNPFLSSIKKSTTISYPMIAIVGPSGSGKSCSLQNLPPDQTLIFNIENKVLPFDTTKFPYVISGPDKPVATQIIDIDTTLAQAKKTPIKYLVLDSFTKYWELLYARCRATNTGYDIFNAFNSGIFNFIDGLKQVRDKFIILLCTDELVSVALATGASVSRSRISTIGKQWEGKIEKEFSIILFTSILVDEKNKSISYRFMTNTDGVNSAKSPPLLGLDKYIPNDIKLVCDACAKSWDLH
jgi:hypothetical protein